MWKEILKNTERTGKECKRTLLFLNLKIIKMSYRFPILSHFNEIPAPTPKKAPLLFFQELKQNKKKTDVK